MNLSVEIICDLALNSDLQHLCVKEQDWELQSEQLLMEAGIKRSVQERPGMGKVINNYIFNTSLSKSSAFDD